MKDLKVFIRRKWVAAVLAGSLLVLLLGGVVFAAVAAATIDWRAFSNGGGTSSSPSGDVTLVGSIGQPAAGISIGGEVGLGSGFVSGIAKSTGSVFGFEVFIPVLMDE